MEGENLCSYFYISGYLCDIEYFCRFFLQQFAEKMLLLRSVKMKYDRGVV